VSTTLLGVRIDTLTKAAVQEKLRAFLGSQKTHIVTTPNPEILMAAVHDKGYREALNTADLNVCDGRGIELLAKEPIERFPGVDVLLCLLTEAARAQKKVFLFGTGSDTTLAKAASALQNQIPDLQICGVHPGQRLVYMVEDGVGSITPRSQEKEEALIDTIIATAPDVLVVALGHPKQELWITEHVGELPSVRIAIGVGGSLDTIAGRVPRAPAFMRNIGLEWFWRLIHEPKRIKRILTAVLIFPLYVFLERIGVRSFTP
jgi:N-acetylglucosaminyldiphosphoundecaprenol N-acetyl-beta-D-mannosaminyltransferase